MSVLRSKYVVIPALIIITLIAATTARMMMASSNVVEEELIDDAKITQGIDVYLSSYCGACHTLEAAETRGTFAPPHNDLATVAEEHLADDGYTGNATTIEEYIRESILDPQIYLSPDYIASSHAMPPFTHLGDEDLDALVYMLAHQRTAE